MRFIQVGVGGFGGCWVGALKNNKKAKVVGMVDINKAALAGACETAGYDESICFGSLKEALANVEADAAVVVTPPKLHRKPVVEALKAGLDVISEKPMAESMADCRAMLKAAKQTKRTYVVSQNYRYRPEMMAMADLVRGGKLGKVGQVKLDFFKGHDFGGGFRHSMDYPLIVDMSIHHFDLLRFITGLDPKSVKAEAWNPSWSNYKGDCSSTALFEMTGGARVLYNGSWCAKGDYCDWNGNWHIECEKGTVRYENGKVSLVEVPDLYAMKKTRPVKPKKMKLEGQAYVLDEFIRRVKDRKRPATDVYDNMHSIAMVFATVQAMKTGRRVPVLDAATKKLLAGKR